jgi:hypothetical protein
MNVITNVNWGKKEEPGRDICEPEPRPCVLLTGAEVTTVKGVVTFVGWTDIDGDYPERRIETRFAIPMDVAAELHEALAEHLPSEGS